MRQRLALAVAQVLRQNQIISALFDGTLRNIQEPGFLSRATLAEALGNIGGNGNRRTTQLVRKPILLSFRKRLAVALNR